MEQATREVLADTTLKLSGDDRSHLDGEAARAKTPAARAVYDPHRLSAYIEIGHAERAIPMLEQSQRDFPDDYNPPARLALAYRSDMYVGKGDKDAAIKTLEEAIAYAQALPEGQRSKNTVNSLQKRIDKLKAPPAGP
jgi:tetratricopeptide (TPR) repeat protein